MSKHTEGEWIKPNSFHQLHDDHFQVFIRIDELEPENKFTVACAYGRTKEEAEANAEKMVKAVNMFDKLIEGLKEIAEGKGRYNPDQLKHCENTVADMKLIASELIKQSEQ